MFQYAFGLRLAEHHKTELKLDLSFYSDPASFDPPRTYDLDIFNINASIASDSEIRRFAQRVNHDLTDRVLNRIFGPKKTHVREPHYHFSEIAFNSPDNVYLNGYWQSTRYFHDVESRLRQEFSFRDPPCMAAKPILERIESTESVCVHVRRGDFLTNPLNGLHGREYYDKGAEIIRRSKSNLSFFVFSDDIPWCRENLEFNGDMRFMDDDFEPQKFRDDLRLMAACKNFIIANSSFSWWAAWMNQHPAKIVVAPPSWATDPSIDKSEMYLPGWIRISG
jgi:hypothetical protein